MFPVDNKLNAIKILVRKNVSVSYRKMGTEKKHMGNEMFVNAREWGHAGLPIRVCAHHALSLAFCYIRAMGCCEVKSFHDSN